MKKALVLLVFAFAVTLVTGCDFLRSIIGRPTSDQIEAKRALVEKAEGARQAVIDSLKSVQQKGVADSLAVLDSLAKLNSTILEGRQVSEDVKSTLGNRYFIIIGSFYTKENADRLCAAARNKGYNATLINYKNGFTAVGLNPSDKLVDVYESLVNIKQEEFCPADVWILDIKR